jgi:hypothetical protein
MGKINGELLERSFSLFSKKTRMGKRDEELVELN